LEITGSIFFYFTEEMSEASQEATHGSFTAPIYSPLAPPAVHLSALRISSDVDALTDKYD